VTNGIIKIREEKETTNMLIEEMKGLEDGARMTLTDRIGKGL
jgi:hypothetical protein